MGRLALRGAGGLVSVNAALIELGDIEEDPLEWLGLV